MAGTIKVGCTLPHGIVIFLNNVSVTLAGANQKTNEFFKILGDFGITDVDSDFWIAWKEANTEFQPLKSGAIFEAKDEKSVKDKGKDQSTIGTGFDPLPPDSNGVETDADK